MCANHVLIGLTRTRVDPRHKIRHAVFSNIAKILYGAVLQISAKILACFIDNVAKEMLSL